MREKKCIQMNSIQRIFAYTNTIRYIILDAMNEISYQIVCRTRHKHTIIASTLSSQPVHNLPNYVTTTNLILHEESIARSVVDTRYPVLPSRRRGKDP